MPLVDDPRPPASNQRRQRFTQASATTGFAAGRQLVCFFALDLYFCIGLVIVLVVPSPFGCSCWQVAKLRKTPLEALHRPATQLVAKWKKAIEADNPAELAGSVGASGDDGAAAPKRSRRARTLFF